MKRLYHYIAIEHFSKYRQMLFLMGPRQVGKTTTAKSLLPDQLKHSNYLNWDNQDHRSLILSGQTILAEHLVLNRLATSLPIIVFDEIHKYKDWKNFLKGFYDTYSERCRILVTGSARLDTYRKGSDSLMGRYLMYRFHPLSVAELINTDPLESEFRAQPQQFNDEIFAHLWKFGGYPDPFFTAETRFYNRWRQLRNSQLFNEDVRDLSKVHEIKQLELLARVLQEQVGGQCNYNALAQKIRVSDTTIRSWITLLESTYYCFLIRPWSNNVIRSLIKEPKCYLWDWSQCKEIGSRSENFIAAHLLKAVHFWTDHGFGQYELHYVRDKEKREVDFLISKDNEPWILIEVKYRQEKKISSSLRYFSEQLRPCYTFQVVIDTAFINANCFTNSEIKVVPARTLLSQLV